MTQKTTDFRLPKYASPYKYHIELKPNLEQKTFEGNVQIEINILEKTNEISLNVAEIEVQEISVDQNSKIKSKVSGWDIDNEYEIMKISFDDYLSEGQLILSLKYKGILNDKLRGFYHSTFTDNNGIKQSIATTQFESTDARRAFPCFDEPEYKAVFSVSLVIDKKLFCVSNAATKNINENFSDGLKKIDF